MLHAKTGNNEVHRNCSRGRSSKRHKCQLSPKYICRILRTNRLSSFMYAHTHTHVKGENKEIAQQENLGSPTQQLQQPQQLWRHSTNKCKQGSLFTQIANYDLQGFNKCCCPLPAAVSPKYICSFNMETVTSNYTKEPPASARLSAVQWQLCHQIVWCCCLFFGINYPSLDGCNTVDEFPEKLRTAFNPPPCPLFQIFSCNFFLWEILWLKIMSKIYD